MSAEGIRDELRDELSGYWVGGASYYSHAVGIDDAGEMADLVLASEALARVKREAAAGALEEAADAAKQITGPTAGLSHHWLRARAAAIREGATQ